MKRVYDVAIAVVAGLLTFAITEGLDWLHGWQAWVAAAVVAIAALALLLLVVQERGTSQAGSSGFKFIHKIRTDKGVEVDATTVESSGSGADYITDVKAADSIKIKGSKFSHTNRPPDRGVNG